MKDQAIFIREDTAWGFALRLSEKLKGAPKVTRKVVRGELLGYLAFVGSRPVFEEDLV